VEKKERNGSNLLVDDKTVWETKQHVKLTTQN